MKWLLTKRLVNALFINRSPNIFVEVLKINSRTVFTLKNGVKFACDSVQNPLFSSPLPFQPVTKEYSWFVANNLTILLLMYGYEVWFLAVRKIIMFVIEA
jgi:hypothetical protein